MDEITLDSLEDIAKNATTWGNRYWDRRDSREGGRPPHFELVAVGPTFPAPWGGTMATHPLNIIKSDDQWQPSDADADLLAACDPDTILELIRLARKGLENEL